MAKRRRLAMGVAPVAKDGGGVGTPAMFDRGRRPLSQSCADTPSRWRWKEQVQQHWLGRHAAPWGKYLNRIDLLVWLRYLARPIRCPCPAACRGWPWPAATATRAALAASSRQPGRTPMPDPGAFPGHVTRELKDSHTGLHFLSFMKKVVRQYPGRELHVILDNSSTHSTPDVQAWLAANANVRFHYTPTSASWLNQVEGFFGILGKQSLSASNFPSKRALREHIAAYMRDWNRNPTAFEWTKPAAAIIRSHRRMLDRISRAVH
jgi:transposase